MTPTSILELDLFGKMGEYTPFGPKEDEFKEYEKLEFIQTNLDAFPVNEIDGFSLALGKLYRWLSSTIELRIEDVTQRRAEKERERKYRQEQCEREDERMALREERLAGEKAQWEEIRDAELAVIEKEDGDEAEAEKQEDLEFDMEEFDEKFNDEEPPVDIPPEVIDDIDNDFNLEIRTEEEEDDGEDK